MNIGGRLRVPGTLVSGVPNSSEQLQSTTISSGEGIGEADGALSGARRDSKAEKGLDIVLAVTAGDIGGGGREGGCWGVFLDHGTDFRVDDKRAGS